MPIYMLKIHLSKHENYDNRVNLTWPGEIKTDWRAGEKCWFLYSLGFSAIFKTFACLEFCNRCAKVYFCCKLAPAGV